MTDLSLARHLQLFEQGRALRLMNYHNTPPSMATELHEDLSIMLRRFDAVGLEELDTFFQSGAWPSDRPAFLPVFYEGYANSARVAAAVCDDLGIGAWFPVCTDFIATAPREQEFFARSHSIGLLPGDLSGNRLAMSWEEVRSLGSRHLVTAHTASHVGIDDVLTDADLEREVRAPKAIIEAATGREAAAFAWLHGTAWGVSERHDAAVRDAGYRYLISNTMVHRIA